eukprot:TRINITY_DN4249_c6_g1_i1.p1 TRINITY_DN4249_c6_g1~~TRINITY_DN4249_c6_g1_i1.p1  ORF type:complete len:114 (-),score=7.36 TRINITY_DN4249_c6_g1_i1:794-1135(-)
MFRMLYADATYKLRFWRWGECKNKMLWNHIRGPNKQLTFVPSIFYEVSTTPPPSPLFPSSNRLGILCILWGVCEELSGEGRYSKKKKKKKEKKTPNAFNNHKVILKRKRKNTT